MFYFIFIFIKIYYLIISTNKSENEFHLVSTHVDVGGQVEGICCVLNIRKAKFNLELIFLFIKTKKICLMRLKKNNN